MSFIKLIAFLVVIAVLTAFRSNVYTKIINTKATDSNSVLNLKYGNNINSAGKQQSLTMDIHFPPNAIEGKKYPMVMLMHGGGFVSGKKENMTGPCQQLADSGFIAVTINYRIGWNVASRLSGCDSIDVTSLLQANYRALQDAHAALRFLAGNAKKYHIDTNWMFIGGSSAGGVTALNVVYLKDQFVEKFFTKAVSNLGSIKKATNSYTNEFKIKGICNMWGALPDSNLVTKTSAIPTIFYHGTADAVVPYNKGPFIPGCENLPQLYGSAPIYRQTLAAGQHAILNTSLGGKHGPVEYTRIIMMSDVACFFHQVMLGKAKSASYIGVKSGYK